MVPGFQTYTGMTQIHRSIKQAIALLSGVTVSLCDLHTGETRTNAIKADVVASSAPCTVGLTCRFCAFILWHFQIATSLFCLTQHRYHLIKIYQQTCDAHHARVPNLYKSKVYVYHPSPASFCNVTASKPNKECTSPTQYCVTVFHLRPTHPRRFCLMIQCSRQNVILFFPEHKHPVQRL